MPARMPTATMVEWGYSKDGAANPAAMTYHNMVKLDTIYERTAPGAMQSYSERFTAPSQLTTIWVYAVKKWATVERELDVNLDNVALRMCRTVTQPPVVQPPKSSRQSILSHPARSLPSSRAPTLAISGTRCSAGDTLSALAARYNTSVAAIMAKNGLTNPNLIYVGQWLCIPDPPAAATLPAAPSVAQTTAAAATAAQSNMTASASDAATAAQPDPNITASTTTHRVQRGDTLSGIAQRYGTTVQALMTANDIRDANWLFIGQRVQVPSR